MSNRLKFTLIFGFSGAVAPGAFLYLVLLIWGVEMTDEVRVTGASLSVFFGFAVGGRAGMSAWEIHPSLRKK